MTTITISSAKLAITFQEGKLPAIDPTDPGFELALGGVMIAGKINAKAARKLAAHQGGAVLSGRLLAAEDGNLILAEAGFVWLEPRPSASGAQAGQGGTDHATTTEPRPEAH